MKKAEFVAKADAICRSSDAQVSERNDRLGDTQDEAAVLALVHDVADIQLAAIARVRDIGTPDSGAAPLNQLIDGAETTFTAAKSAASQADIDRADRELDALLLDVRALGFKVCGGQRASNG